MRIALMKRDPCITWSESHAELVLNTPSLWSNWGGKPSLHQAGRVTKGGYSAVPHDYAGCSTLPILDDTGRLIILAVFITMPLWVGGPMIAVYTAVDRWDRVRDRFWDVLLKLAVAAAFTFYFMFVGLILLAIAVKAALKRVIGR